MAFNINAQVILSGPKNIKAVTKKIQTQLSGLSATVDLKIAKGTGRSVSALNRHIATLNTNLATLTTNAAGANTALASLGTSLKTVNTGSANFAKTQNNVNNALKNTSQQLKVSQSAMHDFGEESARAIRRFGAFTIATGTIFGFVRAVQTATKEALNFEREMVKLQQITGRGKKSLDGIRKSVDELSRSLGIDANELLKIGKTFAQTGQTLNEVERSMRAVARASLAPTFGTMESTTEGLIAAMAQFNIKAADSEKVLGALNAVSKKFAVESQDLISNIRRAGGVFAATAKQMKEPIQSLHELNSIFVAVRSTTRETSDTIATGLRTIFSRIQRPRTIDFLREFNIELVDAQGNFKGTFESFKLLAKGLDTIISKGDVLTLARITEELGGIRQVGKLIPAIKNFDKAMRALKVSREGALQGLGKDVQLALQPLGKHFDQVKNQFKSLVREFSESSAFQNLARIGLQTAEAFIVVAKALKPLLPLLTTLAAIKISRAAFDFGTGFVGGFRRGGGARGVGGGLAGMATGQGTQQQVAAQATSSKASANLARVLNVNVRGVDRNTAALHRLERSNVGLVAAVERLTIAIGNLRLGGGAAGSTIIGGGGGPAPRPAGSRARRPRIRLRSHGGVVQRLAGGGTVADRLPSAEMQKRVYRGDLAKKLRSGEAFNKGDNFTNVIDRQPYPSRIPKGYKGHGRQLTSTEFEKYIAIRKKVGIRALAGGNKPIDLPTVGTEVKRTNEYVGNAIIRDKVLRAIKGREKQLKFKGIGRGLKNNWAVRSGKGKWTAGVDQVSIPDVEVAEPMIGKVAISRTHAGRIGLKRTTKRKARRAAAGGSIFAPRGTDTVPAMLTPGEFVINRASAERIGYGNLEGMNRMAKGGVARSSRMQYFADGTRRTYADNLRNRRLNRVGLPWERYQRSSLDKSWASAKARPAPLRSFMTTSRMERSLNLNKDLNKSWAAAGRPQGVLNPPSPPGNIAQMEKDLIKMEKSRTQVAKDSTKAIKAETKARGGATKATKNFAGSTVGVLSSMVGFGTMLATMDFSSSERAMQSLQTLAITASVFGQGLGQSAKLLGSWGKKLPKPFKIARNIGRWEKGGAAGARAIGGLSKSGRIAGTTLGGIGKFAKGAGLTALVALIADPIIDFVGGKIFGQRKNISGARGIEGRGIEEARTAGRFMGGASGAVTGGMAGFSVAGPLGIIPGAIIGAFIGAFDGANVEENLQREFDAFANLGKSSEQLAQVFNEVARAGLGIGQGQITETTGALESQQIDVIEAGREAQRRRRSNETQTFGGFYATGFSGLMNSLTGGYLGESEAGGSKRRTFESMKAISSQISPEAAEQATQIWNNANTKLINGIGNLNPELLDQIAKTGNLTEALNASGPAIRGFATETEKLSKGTLIANVRGALAEQMNAFESMDTPGAQKAAAAMQALDNQLTYLSNRGKLSQMSASELTNTLKGMGGAVGNAAVESQKMMEQQKKNIAITQKMTLAAAAAKDKLDAFAVAFDIFGRTISQRIDDLKRSTSRAEGRISDLTASFVEAREIEFVNPYERLETMSDVDITKSVERLSNVVPGGFAGTGAGATAFKDARDLLLVQKQLPSILGRVVEKVAGEATTGAFDPTQQGDFTQTGKKLSEAIRREIQADPAGINLPPDVLESIATSFDKSLSRQTSGDVDIPTALRVGGRDIVLDSVKDFVARVVEGGGKAHEMFNALTNAGLKVGNMFNRLDQANIGRRMEINARQFDMQDRIRSVLGRSPRFGQAAGRLQTQLGEVLGARGAQLGERLTGQGVDVTDVRARAGQLATQRQKLEENKENIQKQLDAGNKSREAMLKLASGMTNTNRALNQNKQATEMLARDVSVLADLERQAADFARQERAAQAGILGFSDAVAALQTGTPEGIKTFEAFVEPMRALVKASNNQMLTRQEAVTLVRAIESGDTRIAALIETLPGGKDQAQAISRTLTRGISREGQMKLLRQGGPPGTFARFFPMMEKVFVKAGLGKKALAGEMGRVATEQARILRDAMNTVTTHTVTQIGGAADALKTAIKELTEAIRELSIGRSGFGGGLGFGLSDEEALRAVESLMSGAAKGGRVTKFAKGGFVKGRSHEAGGVLANLEGGEYVVPKKFARGGVVYLQGGSGDGPVGERPEWAGTPWAIGGGPQTALSPEERRRQSHRPSDRPPSPKITAEYEAEQRALQPFATGRMHSEEKMIPPKARKAFKRGQDVVGENVPHRNLKQEAYAHFFMKEYESAAAKFKEHYMLTDDRDSQQKWVFAEKRIKASRPVDLGDQSRPMLNLLKFRTLDRLPYKEIQNWTENLPEVIVDWGDLQGSLDAFQLDFPGSGKGATRVLKSALNDVQRTDKQREHDSQLALEWAKDEELKALNKQATQARNAGNPLELEKINKKIRELTGETTTKKVQQANATKEIVDQVKGMAARGDPRAKEALAKLAARRARAARARMAEAPATPENVTPAQIRAFAKGQQRKQRLSRRRRGRSGRGYMGIRQRMIDPTVPAPARGGEPPPFAVGGPGAETWRKWVESGGQEMPSNVQETILGTKKGLPVAAEHGLPTVGVYHGGLGRGVEEQLRKSKLIGPYGIKEETKKVPVVPKVKDVPKKDVSPETDSLHSPQGLPVKRVAVPAAAEAAKLNAQKQVAKDAATVNAVEKEVAKSADAAAVKHGLEAKEVAKPAAAADAKPADAAAVKDKPSVFMGFRGDDKGELLKGEGGIQVTRVERGGPALTAGIKVDDIIMELNNELVKDLDTVSEFLKSRRVGEHVNLKVLRDGEVMQLQLKLGEVPRLGGGGMGPGVKVPEEHGFGVKVPEEHGFKEIANLANRQLIFLREIDDDSNFNFKRYRNKAKALQKIRDSGRELTEVETELLKRWEEDQIARQEKYRERTGRTKSKRKPGPPQRPQALPEVVRRAGPMTGGTRVRRRTDIDPKTGQPRSFGARRRAKTPSYAEWKQRKELGIPATDKQREDAAIAQSYRAQSYAHEAESETLHETYEGGIERSARVSEWVRESPEGKALTAELLAKKGRDPQGRLLSELTPHGRQKTVSEIRQDKMKGINKGIEKYESIIQKKEAQGLNTGGAHRQLQKLQKKRAALQRIDRQDAAHAAHLQGVSARQERVLRKPPARPDSAQVKNVLDAPLKEHLERQLIETEPFQQVNWEKMGYGPGYSPNEDPLPLDLGKPVESPPEPRLPHSYYAGGGMALPGQMRGMGQQAAGQMMGMGQQAAGQMRGRGQQAFGALYGAAASLRNFDPTQFDPSSMFALTGGFNTPFGTRGGGQYQNIGYSYNPFGFAVGGSVFKPRGTDTVPAMLTPGEFVINRKSAQNIGYGTLSKINSMAQGGTVPSPQYLQGGGGVDGGADVAAKLAESQIAMNKLSDALGKIPEVISIELKQNGIVKVALDEQFVPQVKKYFEQWANEKLNGAGRADDSNTDTSMHNRNYSGGSKGNVGY